MIAHDYMTLLYVETAGVFINCVERLDLWLNWLAFIYRGPLLKINLFQTLCSLIELDGCKSVVYI